MAPLPHPSKFRGDRSKLAIFQQLCEKKFELEKETFPTDGHKVYYIRTLTTAKASSYLASCSSELHTAEDAFQALRRLVSADSDPKVEAQKYIRQLRQNAMAYAEFRAAFDSKIMATGYNDDAKNEMFLERLNRKTQGLLRDEDVEKLDYESLTERIQVLVDRRRGFEGLHVLTTSPKYPDAMPCAGPSPPLPEFPPSALQDACSTFEPLWI